MTSPQPHFLLLRDPERVPRPPRCARTSEARAPPNTIPCFNPDAIGAAQLEPLKCLNLRASIVRQTDLLASLRAKLTGRPETPSKRASLSGRRGGARPVDADRGKDDPEAGALADAAVHLDAPAVPIDDAVNDREPEPRALADVLGGEERIEDPRQHVGRDAGTVVAHGDLDLAVAPRGDNLDRAARLALADRLGGVRDQVHEHLIQLAAEATHPQPRIDLLVDPHVAQAVAKQIDGVDDAAREHQLLLALLVPAR